MKIKYIFLSVIVLLFFYQNCSQKQYNENENRRSLSDLQIEKVRLHDQDPTELIKGSAVPALMSRNQYLLDSATGVLDEYNGSGDKVATYCLTQDLLTEARKILSNSQVCKPLPMPPETVCAAVIIPPWAELITQDEVIKLGYGGCDGALNLCDDQSVVFKQWIYDVRMRLPQLVCGP